MRTCSKCGRTELDVPFKPKRNLCMDDWREYKRSYDRDAGQSAKVQLWKVKNRTKYRESCRRHHATPIGNLKHRLRVQKTWRSWFDHLLSALKRHASNPGRHDPKTGPRRDFNLTLDYIVSLSESQGHKCAVTGILLERKMNDLCSASIDRIDPSKGHIAGNIQIVCQFVNYAKRHYANDKIVEALEKYHQARLGADRNQSEPLL